MAFDQIHKAGSTSKTIDVMVRDSTTGQGKTGVAYTSVTARIKREGASGNIAVTMASSTVGSYTSGGWAEVDATNQPGLYQFGIPNTALATGAEAVTLTLKVSGAIDTRVRIVLVNVDLRDGTAGGLSKLAAIEVDEYGGLDVSNFIDENGTPLQAGALVGYLNGASDPTGTNDQLFVGIAGAVLTKLNGNGVYVSNVWNGTGFETADTLARGQQVNDARDAVIAALPDPAFIAGQVTTSLNDDTTPGGLHSDVLRTLAAAQDAASSGTGDIAVDHNYGGTDALRVKDASGNWADNVLIRAYVKADRDAGTIDPNPPSAYTGSDGRWIRSLSLDADTYTVTYYNPDTKIDYSTTLVVA